VLSQEVFRSSAAAETWRLLIAMSNPSLESQETWQGIGLLLALLQSAEHAINTSLQWVFTNDPFGEQEDGNLLDQLSNLKEFQRKKNLGQLQSALRARVSLHPEFEVYFAKFVEDRNRFAHRLFLEHGFNVGKPEDNQRIRQFVDDLASRTVTIIALFHAFIINWAEEHDLAVDDYACKSELFNTKVQSFRSYITKKT
jgi:hypothetical protein